MRIKLLSLRVVTKGLVRWKRIGSCLWGICGFVLSMMTDSFLFFEKHWMFILYKWQYNIFHACFSFNNFCAFHSFSEFVFNLVYKLLILVCNLVNAILDSYCLYQKEFKLMRIKLLSLKIVIKDLVWLVWWKRILVLVLLR